MKTTRQYGPNADLALSMWVKLARASSTFERLSARDIERYGLTSPQFAVLESLGHLGAMSIGMLGKKMLVSGGNMTVVVDNLVRRGFVTRVHGDSDRRTIIVDLTSQGRTLFEKIFPSHAGFISALASVLTQKEQQTLSRLLKKLGTACREHLLKPRS